MAVRSPRANEQAGTPYRTVGPPSGVGLVSVCTDLHARSHGAD